MGNAIEPHAWAAKELWDISKGIPKYPDAAIHHVGIIMCPKDNLCRSCVDKSS